MYGAAALHFVSAQETRRNCLRELIFLQKKTFSISNQEEERLLVELRQLLGPNSHTSLYRNSLSCPRMKHLDKAQDE